MYFIYMISAPSSSPSNCSHVILLKFEVSFSFIIIVLYIWIYVNE